MNPTYAPCALCGRPATDLHHIVPRSRTSRKHPAEWLNDPRNLIALCQGCHSNDRPTRVRCVQVMRERHKDWDYNVAPWAEYLEGE